MNGRDQDRRPNPDLLLKAVQKEEEKQARGKLKVFLGMAAGVGKTYSMLSAAQHLKAEGVEVVVALAETHGRAETEALLKGLEVIPRRIVPYRNVTLEEMDLDAVLKRRPQVALVDEAAHTNAPGSRHAKRYLDILEILDGGIDVYTTLNIQHLESRAETVREITRVKVMETVPDSIIDLASEVVLVDLAPEELIRRLEEGKIYGVERGSVAAQNFFQPGNLTALREMSLRLVAEKVNQELRDWRQLHHITDAWKTRHRLMVAVYASPYSEILIRWTRRMAAGLDAPWLAAYVESPEHPLREDERRLLANNLALVKELGGEVLETVDDDPVRGLLRLAGQNQATQLVVGKSRRGFFHNLRLGGSVTKRLLEESGNLDIYVVSGERPEPGAAAPLLEPESLQVSWLKIAAAVLVPVLIGALGSALEPSLGYRGVGLLLLIGVAVLGLFAGRAALLSAILSGLIWDYFFIPPRFTFAIAAPENIILFALYLVVALIISHLATRLRNNQRLLRLREQRITALYRLTKEIASAKSLEKVIETAVKHLGDIFEAEVAVLVKEPDRRLSEAEGSAFGMDDKEKAVAEWVALHSRPAGLFTDTLPGARGFYLPLIAHGQTVGVLGLRPRKPKRTAPDLMILAETFAQQLAVGIERELLKGNRDSGLRS